MAGKTDKAALREMMRQHREAQGKAKINDPLARYSPAGELFCVLCNTPVKSDRVWTAHVQGRAHKQQLQALRSRSAASSAPSQSATSGSSSTSAQRATAGANGSSSSASVDPSAQNQNKRKFTALVQDYSDDDEDDDNEPDDGGNAGKRVKTSAASTASGATSKLPPGFFDNRAEQPATDQMDAEEGDAKTDKTPTVDTRTIEEKLPEGFFDDKKQDAKARKVEYVDPQEAEYEKFQAEMLRANVVSEHLVDQDDDEAQDIRHYLELNETLAHAQRVDTLQDVMQKKLVDARNARRAARDEEMDMDSGSSDDDMFDWRAKKLSKKS